MNATTHNIDCDFLTIKQTASKLGLGIQTTRRLAEEAGALVIVTPKCVRINYQVLYDHIVSTYQNTSKE